MITVVLPTYEEGENVGLVLPALLAEIERLGREFEVLVVDDSPCNITAEVAASLLGPRGRVLRRGGRPGLSRALVHGIDEARGDVLLLMDADMEHPPEVAPLLLRPVIEGTADVAIGSRLAPGGGMEGRSRLRRAFTRIGARLARRVARNVHDPLTGFIALRRSVLEGVRLGTLGFKLGLEILARGRYRTVVEVPYVHRSRNSGASKFGLRAASAFVLQLVLLWLRPRPKST